MLKPAFIDISHWQTVTPSFQPAKDAGILAVVHKAIEGQTNKDPKLPARFQLAQDAGLLFGTYHFVRPGKISDQVDHYLSTCEKYSTPNSLYALDWEDAGVSLDDAV